MIIDDAFVGRIAERIAGLELRMSESAAGSNREAFKAMVREHAHLKRIAEKAGAFLKLKKERDEYVALLAEAGSDKEMEAQARAELAAVEAQIPAAEREVTVALLPPEGNETRDAIMEIRAGTGGEEAALFAADLFRMYSRFADRRGWAVETLDASPSEIGGFKEVIFSVRGPGSYSLLRFEAGTHRVQRVPATEAAGRIHTSAATVAVMPEAEDIDEIEIKPEDLRIDTCRASGAGGQHVNKTDSAVRITHLPTGIAVKSQDERSQHRNREKAMRLLRSRLLALREQQEAERIGDARRAQIGSGDRSERIRTYNFPQNRVTDHRVNLTLYSLDRVMDGELDQISDALRDAHTARRLAGEHAALGVP